MRAWWQDLTDLVLPADCGGCGRPRAVLCPQCRRALTGPAPSRVRPVPEPPGLPVVCAAAPYEDTVRAVLLAHKERGALALAHPLGAALAGSVRAVLQEVRDGRGVLLEGPGRVSTGRQGRPAGPRAAVLLVPVPSARGAVRARGHDPVRRIALAAAAELRRTGTPARMLAVLRQRRAVADQSGLGSRQRLANLAGALEAVPGGRLPAGARVVLVDDLLTTGATLAEAARALRTAPRADGASDVRDVGDGATAVYAAPLREGMEERRDGSGGVANGARGAKGNRVYDAPERAGANSAVRPVTAAVVAAPPDSFEILWN
ncbi:phosphoribosyltransferase family protein [Streptomyces sp. NPDC047000]|uniref:ComF family protein n=1 Tax=Streptomyces sp. NPDC047000 TaxID=3155474 RepID=UPI00340C61E6